LKKPLNLRAFFISTVQQRTMKTVDSLGKCG
jgi:hypothetical protein